MASVTKMFTATAIMLLVREGRLSVDDEYTKFFPEYPYKGVTVRHLLTHTSGLPEGLETDDLVCPVWEDEHRIPPCSEMLRFLVEYGKEAGSTPGEKFEYNDINYCLLANLVEKLSGEKFEDYLKKNVFEPAGMKDSAIYHTRRDGRPSERFTRNMVLEDDGYVPSDVSELTAPYVVGSDGLNGCDYLYTTIFDMLAWDRTLRAGKVVTLEEQKIMYTTVRLNSGEDFIDEDGEGYGFGWCVRQDEEHGLIVCHSGGMPGLETWFEHYVDEDRTLVILNCRDYSDVRAFVSFWEGLQATAKGEEPEPFVSMEDVAVKDPDKSKWESFCGKYEHPEDDDFIIDEVFMKDGDLYARAVIDDDETTFRLYPIGENEFGRKRGMLKLTFGDGCLMFDDFICKKC
jgi:CubicO group peptidase (beta-lactamase class C family)